MVAAFASRGFSVIGLDINKRYVKKLSQSKAPVEETGLQSLLTKFKHKISATSDFDEAISRSNITFIIVPTPSQKNGSFGTEFVADAAYAIGKALAKINRYHLVVLTSTVLPGGTERDIIPVLEKSSGKKLGRDFGVCYNPEFIALGSVIQNLLDPDLILIGESDPRAGKQLQAFYERFLPEQRPIKRMAIVNAELVKISINTFVTNKIAFANALLQICSNIPGANVDTVTDAIGQDRRIGTKYLKGGLGFGGPCFPRDNRAFSFLAKSVGARHLLAETTDQVNHDHLDWVVKLITKQALKRNRRPKICILGLSYKPHTGITEESQSLHLAIKLAAKFPVTVYDPGISISDFKQSNKNLKHASSLQKATAGADLICIATPWPQFKRLPIQKNLKRRPLVIDLWRHADGRRISTHADYLAVGVHNVLKD